MLERLPSDLLPQYRLDWHDASAEWSVAPQHPSHAELVPYTIWDRGFETIFEIIAPKSTLDELWISFATFARKNSVIIRCELLDGKRSVIRGRDLEPGTIVDNALNLALDLRGLDFVVGQKYWVRLSSPNATEGNSFATWCRRTDFGKYTLPPRLVSFRNQRLFAYHDSGAEDSARAPFTCFAVVGGSGNYSGGTGAALRMLADTFPNHRFTVIDLGDEDELARVWPRLAGADVVAFCDLEVGRVISEAAFDNLCFALYRNGVCTIFADGAAVPASGAVPQLDYADSVRGDVARRLAVRRRCRYILQPDSPRLSDSDRPLEDIAGDPAANDPLASLVSQTVQRRLPRVAVVSVLYKKADVIERFIDHVVAQSYPGDISVVLVDDRSPQNDSEIARAYGEKLIAGGVWNRSVQLFENDANEGNCISRLEGLESVVADIFIVIDCDCLINRDFVAAHVFEHARDDVDAVIGPLNIESWDRDPAALVRELEEDPDRVQREANPQDPVQQDGFLNCVTRNFSVKERIVRREPLFDVDFAYSSKAGSGFGWEDVEMGYRIYARAGVIRFTDRAFSVHVTHDSSASEAAKINGSFRNFNRLFDKHPEMEFVARRWAVDTYDKLITWAGAAGVDTGSSGQDLERRFRDAAEQQRPLTLSYRPGSRRLRILTYRWHAPHQYELYKLPHDFTLATHIGDNGMVNSWSFDQRPMRDNVRLVPAQEIDPRDYDLAILHFDENVLSPSLCNNVIPGCWGDAFDWLKQVPDLPKVAICHGTPQFAGQYALNGDRIHSFDVHEDERVRLVRDLAEAEVKVVCNSWQALEEWGFADSRVIWHGFDPQEFPAATHTRHILALGPDRHRPHYRGAWEHALIEARLDPSLKIETAEHAGAALERFQTNAYAVRNFRSYVDRIRQFTAYLNTTLRSPMPRSRGEAMMTGVIPVALANHDVQRFITPGTNGFYSDDPAELADWLNYLFGRPDEVKRISHAARRTAIDVFNHDRYLTGWTHLIKDSIGERVAI